MSLIGEPLTRREDPPLLTGRGVYVDDVAPPGTLHAYVVRSPQAHAQIAGIDVTAAREAAGVAAVFTAPDLAACGVVANITPVGPYRADVPDSAMIMNVFVVVKPF